jgi:hypothetical protein
MRPSVSESEPSTRVLNFGTNAEAFITSFDNTTTVNWTASSSVGPHAFGGVARRVLDLSSPSAITVQRAGEEVPDWDPLGPPPDVTALDDLDELVRFVRIDISERKSVAWQRINANLVFVGMGADSPSLDLEEMRKFIEETADKEVNLDETLSAVSTELAAARGNHEGPDDAASTQQVES